MDYCYKTKPFQHQADVFNHSRDKEAFALLMEQGTGKTKVTIDTAAWLYAKGDIDALLVIAPNGVQRNWILNEIPIHMPDYCYYKMAWYSSSPTKKEEEAVCRVLEHDGLKIIAMNIEAFATVKGVSFAKNFLISFKSMLVIDESSTIKSPKAQRTKNLLKLSQHAKYRRILTGTPITQGPLDVYTQFTFLDPTILRTSSYYAFRNRYAVMREMRTAGRSFQTIVGYQNLEELQKLIAPHSYRVIKSECLDLPAKLYSKRYVQLSDSQRKLYNTLKKDVVAELNGKTMSAPLALTKLLRLQQIVGGFFVPDKEYDFSVEDIILDGDSDTAMVRPTHHPSRMAETTPIDAVNPRIESLIELLEETNGKVIIWARFRAEIAAICKRIESTFGVGCTVEYHGGIDPSDRSDNVRRFQTEDSCKFFVGHVKAGGKGLTLHAANTVVYFSNNFSLEDRLQSEDRAHRIGQQKNVTYIDMIATNTLDEHVVKTLRSKKDVADLITGDSDISQWI